MVANLERQPQPKEVGTKISRKAFLIGLGATLLTMACKSKLLPAISPLPSQKIDDPTVPATSTAPIAETPTPKTQSIVTTTPETKANESKDKILARIKENCGITLTPVEGAGRVLTPELAGKFEEIFSSFPNLKGIVKSGFFKSDIVLRLTGNLFTGYYGEMAGKGNLTFDIPPNFKLNDPIPKGTVEPFENNAQYAEYVGLRELYAILVSRTAWGNRAENPIYKYFAPLLGLTLDEKGFHRTNNPGDLILGSRELTTGAYDGRPDGPLAPKRIDHVVGSGFAFNRMINKKRFDPNRFPEEQRLTLQATAAFDAFDAELERNPADLLSAPADKVLDIVKFPSLPKPQ